MKQYLLREQKLGLEQTELASYPKLLQDLLYSRGITSRVDAEIFLHPDYDLHTHDPFLMKNMNRAVNRILKAIQNEEKIVIYTDYDCDGGPAGVLLYDFFKKIGYDNFINYIPHRHEEGYGLNTSALDSFAKEGATLLITADLGITDREPVAYANELGIDVIITDHHEPNGEGLPEAFAILNAKQEDDTYPYNMLCGAGVAFKLVQALLRKGNFNITEGWEKWLLDMAGLATIADMVPLTGENRVLAYYGLKVMRKSPRPGFMKLCRTMKVRQKAITEDDVGFMIAPRINAASRMGKPMDAFHLLTTDDEVRAGVLSEHLERINNERKGIVASMVKEMKKRIEGLSELRDVLVLGNTNWRPALLGLAANSAVEDYKRPVFLWGREGGDFIKGSCRSDGSVNVVELMGLVKDFFIDFGGHKMSGGFSVPYEKIHTLESALLGAYQKVKNKDGPAPVYIDKKLSMDDVGWGMYGIIEQLAPFGEANPKPVFLFEGAVVESIKHFGKENNHLELGFKNSQGKKIPAIGFFKKHDHFDTAIKEGKPTDLVATLEKSMFRNFPELRLRIVDVL